MLPKSKNQCNGIYTQKPRCSKQTNKQTKRAFPKYLSLMRSDLLVIMVKLGNNISSGHGAFAESTSAFHLHTLPAKLPGYVFGTIILAL